MAVKFQLRRGLKSDWLKHNPILLEGEIGIELDTRQIKIGDGKTKWDKLPYMTQGDRGDDGDNLEFNWKGTQLGVRVEGESTYQYVDLKGEAGYTPIKGIDYFDGEKGEKGDPFRFEDFTKSQLETLRIKIGQEIVKFSGLRELIEDAKQTNIQISKTISQGKKTEKSLSSLINISEQEKKELNHILDKLMSANNQADKNHKQSEEMLEQINSELQNSILKIDSMYDDNVTKIQHQYDTYLGSLELAKSNMELQYDKTKDLYIKLTDVSKTGKDINKELLNTISNMQDKAQQINDIIQTSHTYHVGYEPPENKEIFWIDLNEYDEENSKSLINQIINKADKSYVDSEIKKAGKVQSVNGQTGDVELIADDIIYGALPITDHLDFLLYAGMELDQKKADQKNIGDLSKLQTKDKSNLVNAINENFQSGVRSNKILVDNLNSKGVKASTSDNIKVNVEKVKEISGEIDWSVVNLLTNSSFMFGLGNEWGENQLVDLNAKNWTATIVFNQTRSTPGIRRNNKDLVLEKGKKYTISLKVKQSNHNNQTVIYLFPEEGDTITVGRITSYETDGWTSYSQTFEVDSTQKYQLMILVNSPQSKGDIMQLREIQIEEGAKANPWRPRVSDVMLDITNSPGSKILIAGTLKQGFFGEVPVSEFIRGDELCNQLGITQGENQFSNEPWLKFALDGKILFRPKKAIRHSISWNHLNDKNCIYGDRTIEIDGVKYKVRLMKGALTDPSKRDASDRGAKGSEWNRLMLPISIKAKDKSWDYPKYVEDNIPYWGIDYTDSDLQVGSGNGRSVWCQEETNESGDYRVSRGYGCVSNSFSPDPSDFGSPRGFAPILEVVE